MTYTDPQLKSALAKMLPEVITQGQSGNLYYTQLPDNGTNTIRDTELLHLCWLVEKALECGNEESERGQYQETLWNEINSGIVFCAENMCDVAFLHHFLNATWQQRTIALCKVKGVEIV